MAVRFPFFIVGCVRSGTTLLRDIVKSHPDFSCPEETHFYRWGDPFGSRGYNRSVVASKLLDRHREIDGIDKPTFEGIVGNSTSRRDLQLRYAKAVMSRNGAGATRWFDKSPQNIYGLPLLAHDFPNARFVHIVRNPLNVAASLVLGKVIKTPDIIGAANYWQEAVSIFNTFRPVIETRTYELKYEDLVAQPESVIADLMAFLDADITSLSYKLSAIHPERDQYRQILGPEDMEALRSICEVWAKRYGYDLA